jgi:LPXTG-motif cell wall-anchored protein
MKKLTTILIGIMFFISALFTGASAFAEEITCADILREGTANINPSLLHNYDNDGDGKVCETSAVQDGIKSPAPVATELPVLGPAEPTTAPGASGTKGQGGDHSSNANPNSQNSHKLADTGADASFIVWLSVGLLSIMVGAVLLIRLRKQSKA